MYLRSASSIFLVLMFFSCSEKNAIDQPGKVSMFRGSLEHAGVSNEKPLTNVSVKWKFASRGAIRGSISVADKNIFFGSADSHLYCVDKLSGNLKWKFKSAGAIQSTPAVSDESVYFTDRTNTLYALSASSGELLWKFQTGTLLLHQWGWDYFLSSPVVFRSSVYIGSGDGYVYGINAKTGIQNWKFKTGGRVRSTPAIKDNILYVGSFDAYLYALDTETGALKWKFETDGVKLNSGSSGWDRNSIDSSPAISENAVVFGSRDGNVYSVHRQTGKLLWKFTYGPTWAISSPAIADGTVYIGWSDNFYFSAIDLKTGKEKWKYQCRYYVYSSPLVTDSLIYVGSHDRSLYAFDKQGNKAWQIRTNGGILSSPVTDNGILFVGSDDGSVYAFEQSEKQPVHKAVFAVNAQPHYWTIDPRLAPYLMSFGYEQLDTTSIKTFFENRISDHDPSVVVSVNERIPVSVLTGGKQSLLRKYLDAGGKIVWTGNIPNVYQFDAGGNITGEDAAQAETALGIKYDITHDWGSYNSHVTPEGKRWGLPDWWIGTFSIAPQDSVQALAVNEYNRPSVWIKRFGGKEGTGFLMYRGWEMNRSARDSELEMIRNMAEFGF